MSKLYPNKEEIMKQYRPIENFYLGHPNQKDDYSIEEYEDSDDNNIRVDRSPSKEMLRIAKFAGQGSDKYPICPFCGHEGVCREHSQIDKLLNRADMFRFILYDNEINIEYREDHLLRFGIIWSGNICFANDPIKSFESVINELYSKGNNRSLEDIKIYYDKLINLNEEFEYISKDKKSSWICSSNLL